MGKVKLTWFFLVVVCGSTANAVVWEVEPSITLAETYSDNIDLAPNALEKSERVTEFLPGIKIDATGKAFDLDFEYRLQGLRYAESDEFDETLTYSRARGKANLIGESVFLDFSGAVNQQIVDPGGRNAISGVTRSDRTEVKQFSIQPYWQTDFGSGGNIRIGYRFGEAAYADRPSNDSKNSGVVAEISGSSPRSPWSWMVDVNQSRIEYESGSSVDLQRVGGELAWSFSGDTSVFIGAGDENNEFSEQIPGLPKIDGAYWDVGFRGRLDRRTTYSLSVGEQHFGTSYDFSLMREAGLLITDISYLEETTTVGQQQLDYEALFEFLTDITGAELPGSDPDVYVRKRFSATATLKLPRSNLRLNAYSENRDYLTSTVPEKDGVTGAALSWTWTALERSELSVEMGWQSFDLLRDPNTPEDIRLQLRVKRDLKYGIFVNFRAWRNNRSGTIAAQEYTTNAVSVGVGKRF